VCVCVHVCVRLCVCLSVYLFLSCITCVCVFTCACTHVRLCVHVCLCKNIYALACFYHRISATLPTTIDGFLSIYTYTCILVLCMPFFFLLSHSPSPSLSPFLSLARLLSLLFFLARALPLDMFPFKYIPSKNRTCFLILAPW